MSNSNLEIEAKKYAGIPLNRCVDTEERYFNSDCLRYDDFIAGATSKYVEAEKLRFAIEQLKSLGQIHDESVMSERARNKIKELEQQLKSIENE